MKSLFHFVIILVTLAASSGLPSSSYASGLSLHDEFALPIIAKASRLELPKAELYWEAAQEYERLSIVNRIGNWWTNSWDLTFNRISQRQLVERFFSQRSSVERLAIKSYLTKRASCVSKQGPKARKLQLCGENVNRVWDKIYFHSVKPVASPNLTAPDCDGCLLGTPLLSIPIDLYAEIVGKKAGDSYDLSISIPSGTPDKALRQAAEYFASILPVSKSFEIMDNARRAGKTVEIASFFPTEMRDLANRFDAFGKDNCHNLALAFIDSLFREKRTLVSEGSHSDALDYLYKSAYFEPVDTTREAVRIGDIVRFGNSHSAVYLVGGYVFMKDDTNGEWPYRFAHISDIEGAATNGKDYIDYNDSEATGAYRRNGVPLSFHFTQGILRPWPKNPLKKD